MLSIFLAGLLHLQPARPPEKSEPIPQQIYLPPADDTLNYMFVAAKGERIYKILSLPAFQKELDKCIVLRTDFFSTPAGPLIVFRCEEE